MQASHQDMRFLYRNGFILETCHICMDSLIISLHGNVNNSKFIKKNPLNFDQHPPLNISKTNFIIFINKKCGDNCKISINGMDTRVVVTKVLGVHLDFQLNWSKHVSGITNKIANHVSVMYRVRPFTVQIVHSFCRQACLPYLNYCCEAWGNTF